MPTQRHHRDQRGPRPRSPLQRAAFLVVLAALVAAGALAGAASGAGADRPLLTPVDPPATSVAPAAPVAVPAVLAAPVAAPVPVASPAAPTAPQAVVPPEVIAASPDVTPLTRIAPPPVPARAPAPAPAEVEPEPEPEPEVAPEPAPEPEGEALADTGAEPQTTAPGRNDRGVDVDHSLSTIPDPPDVGASDTSETFEMERPEQPRDPWSGVRECESGGDYSINTGNGFYGAYQFTVSTWNWVAEIIGRTDLIGVRPDLAAPSDQDRVAQALAFEVRGGGLRHWPVCGRHYG